MIDSMIAQPWCSVNRNVKKSKMCGRTFRISTQGLSDKNRYIQSVTLNGAAYPYSAIRHKDIIAGGELILKMGKKPSEWGQQLLLNEENKK